jgi:FAD/FMN-containing dehydrogenase/Fe-S oxidoreductase
MNRSRIQSLLSAAECELCFDELTCKLYATDASIYQVEPLAIAFPRDSHEAASAVRAAAASGVSVTPRGAGTGLVGGAIGDGLILDCARHNRQITELDLESRTVRVGAGVVLDQLDEFLRPHGYRFGPDVATSSRATLGGMIATNSSGARTLLYGTTADHVISQEIVLANGRVETITPSPGALEQQRKLIEGLVRKHASVIADRMPAGLMKRWPGYAIDRFLRDPQNLNHIFSGSEGTLAAVMSAAVRIVPKPRSTGLGLVFFASIPEAMLAAVELLDLAPAAIEHIDRLLMDQTRGQLQFRAARDLLGLDTSSCESILLIEFCDHVEDKLEDLRARRLGQRTLLIRNPGEVKLVWGLRKAGLSLLTGRKGPAKPVTCVEDTAVLPEFLPDYVSGLESIFRPLALEVCYYGHVGSGLLHVRPVLDLHRPEDLKKLRQVSDEVSALVRQFKGSLAGEHGVGIARTEYLESHLGPELTSVLREIKAAFDPGMVLNPGKIVDDGRFKIDAHLRAGHGKGVELPFTPLLAFAAKDESFIANLEQCNGCGACRKETPTMCPTFAATGDEIMSTRGRANAIRALLEARAPANGELLSTPELESLLADCLSCKACATECPSNVNMALLKAELLHARHRRSGIPLQKRLLSSVDVIGRIGCLAPSLANALLKSGHFRSFLSLILGLSRNRPLPPFARERFDRWFDKRAPGQKGWRGQVMLWDDTYVRHYEPHIGIAAVRVLEAAGFEVILPRQRKCCGRPAFSQGHLGRASKLGRHNLELLSAQSDELPILFLEPSCYSMFAEDYRELKLPGAERVSRRCFQFEHFVGNLLSKEPGALRFRSRAPHLAVHAHCHAKALTDPSDMARLARHLPGDQVTILQTGCCGMAGAFGALESKYELSLRIAEPLIKAIKQQPPGTIVVASGTSCRQQIAHTTATLPLHMAEVLASGLCTTAIAE